MALVADGLAALLAALFYGVWTLALLALVAGLSQALAKFSLDATIQRDIPTQVQASAFGAATPPVSWPGWWAGSWASGSPSTRRGSD